MITNPFIEGLIVLVIGIGCYLGGSIAKVPELTHLGDVLTGVAIGYIGHQALVTPPPHA